MKLSWKEKIRRCWNTTWAMTLLLVLVVIPLVLRYLVGRALDWVRKRTNPKPI